MLTQFRQSVFSRLAGYDDTNDAERLRNDYAMKKITSEKKSDRVGASNSQMGRFETDGLTLPKNLAALTDLSGQWIDRVNDRTELKPVILDIDRSFMMENLGNIGLVKLFLKYGIINRKKSNESCK
jgi:hypothetical protein